MSFDQFFEMFELSSVEFSGVVSFPAVKPYAVVRGAKAPVRWPWPKSDESSPAVVCPLAKAEVCLNLGCDSILFSFFLRRAGGAVPLRT